MAQQRSHPWPGGCSADKMSPPRTTVDAPKTGPPLHCAARDGPKGAQYVERDIQHATRRYRPPGAMCGGLHGEGPTAAPKAATASRRGRMRRYGIECSPVSRAERNQAVWQSTSDAPT